MKLIENIVEPKRLIVLWQAIDKNLGKAAGDRFVVGEISNQGSASKLTYLDSEDAQKAVERGFKGLTTYPYEPNKTYNGSVESVLAKRLPPDSRSDYEDFLKAYRISPEAAGKVSPLALLANTTGTLAGDGFAFLPSFEGIEPPFQFVFEIAGFRHNQGMKIDPISSLQSVEVSFEHDSDNEFDENAVAIYFDDKKLGYAPKGINTAILDLKGKYQISASIERINGTFERPNVLVFVDVQI